jgi:hypothetical protein
MGSEVGSAPPAIDAVHPTGDGSSVYCAPMFGKLALSTLLVAAVCGGCAPAHTTFARPPAAATAFDRAASDAKAVEIADQVIATAGGIDKWNAAKQLAWNTSATTGAKTPNVEYAEAWDRWNGRQHSALHAPDADIVVMRELYGDKGTAFARTGGQPQVIGTADVAKAVSGARDQWQLSTALLFLPFLLEAPGTKLAYVGEGKDEQGRLLDDLKVTFDPQDPTRGGTYHAMVDRTTHQIARIEITKAGQPDTARVGYAPDTVVDVGGMKLATVFHNLGFKDEVITFSKIAATAEPDDALFVPVVQ